MRTFLLPEEERDTVQHSYVVHNSDHIICINLVNFWPPVLCSSYYFQQLYSSDDVMLRVNAKVAQKTLRV